MASVYTHGDDTKSLVQFKDDTSGFQFRDRTYYGMGCNASWGTGGLDGSDIPCSTRIIKTYDSEDQKIGTYYHFQSATSGFGGSIETANTNSPDTFCPLGWQLPYSGTGGDYYNKSRSWNYLFGQYNITINSEDIESEKKVSSYPFSYIRSGHYHGQTGRLYHLTSYGYYTASTNYSNTNINYRLLTRGVDVRITDSSDKRDSNALRCIWKLASGCNYLVYVLK